MTSPAIAHGDASVMSINPQRVRTAAPWRIIPLPHAAGALPIIGPRSKGGVSCSKNRPYRSCHRLEQPDVKLLGQWLLTENSPSSTDRSQSETSDHPLKAHLLWS